MALVLRKRRQSDDVTQKINTNYPKELINFNIFVYHLTS